MQLGVGPLDHDGWHWIHCWPHWLPAIYPHWHLWSHQVQYSQVQRTSELPHLLEHVMACPCLAVKLMLAKPETHCICILAPCTSKVNSVRGQNCLLCALRSVAASALCRLKGEQLLPCRWLIAHANLFTAWLFNVIYSTALVYLSTWVVVNVAPQAGGAGVAEVTAYLNGCNLPKVR